MPYTIKKTNNTVLVEVLDGQLDITACSVTLVGKNYAGYGVMQNTNFVHLLENFANASAPLYPIKGQLWFDTQTNRLKSYHAPTWAAVSGATFQSNTPTLPDGEFWFDTQLNQLWVSADNKFVLVGPQATSKTQNTQLVSTIVLDNVSPTAGSHPIIKALVNDATVFIISTAQAFTLSADYNIAGFSIISPGITLRDDTAQFNGTATNSTQLGSNAASLYALLSNPAFTNTPTFDGDGFTVGATAILKVSAANAATAYISNDKTSGVITFKTKNASSEETALIFKSDSLSPGTSDSIDLGNSTTHFNNAFIKTAVFTRSGATPTFGTSSVGTKLVLNPTVAVAAVDYAIGTNTNTLWNSIPTASTTLKFAWYGGTTEIATLSGTGVLSVNGTLSWKNDTNVSHTVGTNASGAKTINTAAPTGGLDGDIWYRYV